MQLNSPFATATIRRWLDARNYLSGRDTASRFPGGIHVRWLLPHPNFSELEELRYACSLDTSPKSSLDRDTAELVALRHAVLEGVGYEVFSTSKPERQSR